MKIKHVGSNPAIVAHRMVLPGEVIDVPDEIAAQAMANQPAVWQAMEAEVPPVEVPPVSEEAPAEPVESVEPARPRRKSKKEPEA
jgi:hypothetical protein